MIISLTDYVKEIYETMVETPRETLKEIKAELEETVPEPMNCMLEQQPKDDAIAKYRERKGKEMEIVPPTCTGDGVGVI